MTGENYFELGIQRGGVPVTCFCGHVAGFTDAQAWDSDLNSATFGVTPLQVPTIHDTALIARVEEHDYRPELSRVRVSVWGPPGCTTGCTCLPSRPGGGGAATERGRWGRIPAATGAESPARTAPAVRNCARC